MVAWGLQASLSPMSLKGRPLPGGPTHIQDAPCTSTLGDVCLSMPVFSLTGGANRESKTQVTGVVTCVDSLFEKQDDRYFDMSPYFMSLRGHRKV